MITEKQFKSGLRKCPLHPHNSWYLKYAGFGMLECDNCHGFYKSPSKEEVDFKFKKVGHGLLMLEYDPETKTYGADTEHGIEGET